jgi:hypothetical protein
MARLDILRVYDGAVHNFAKTQLGPMIPLFDTGDPNETDHDVSEQVHMATPDRPYGFDIPTDPKTGDVDTKRAEAMLTRPQVTITRQDLDYDMVRNNTNPVRRITYWDQDANFIVGSDHPRPWNIPYTIDIYARLRNDAQKILNYFLYAINPLLVLSIDFCYPWDKKTVSMLFSRIIDNTDYEPGEAARFYHYSVPFMLEAWMFGAFELPSDIRDGALYPGDHTRRTRTVKTIKVNFVDCYSCTVMDTIDVSLSLTKPDLVNEQAPFCPAGVEGLS